MTDLLIEMRKSIMEGDLRALEGVWERYGDPDEYDEDDEDDEPFTFPKSLKTTKMGAVVAREFAEMLE
ncbi:MAG: hypothetical protein HQK54_06325 [Oligoflexales bacterium]|nr:hypothetical protein [Oligoflexales bacterium]